MFFFCTKGDHVWLPCGSNEFDVPIGGRVVHHDGNRIKILDDEGGVSCAQSDKRFTDLSVYATGA